VTVTATHLRDSELASLAGIREAALRRLPPDAVIYLESGAGTESTLRANRDAFARWAIRPQPMTGVSDPDTSATLLGMPLAIPVLTAPFGGDGLFWPDGQQSVARASARCGTLSIVPEVGTFSYEAVRAAAPAAARIAQLHPYESFSYVTRRIRDAGYEALCVTVDCPMTGYRAGGAAARGIPDRLVWSGNHLGDGTPSANDMFRLGVSARNPAWTWERLAEAAAAQDLPWIAKGILTPEAAEAALGAGAAAIVVSNHGGRQVDPAPASLDMLPAVAAAVAGRVPLLMDSGIRSAADILIALALGADAVVIGRLAAYGLAAAGEDGVRRTIELLAEELRTLMILAGIGNLASVTRTTVTRR